MPFAPHGVYWRPGQRTRFWHAQDLNAPAISLDVGAACSRGSTARPVAVPELCRQHDLRDSAGIRICHQRINSMRLILPNRNAAAGASQASTQLRNLVWATSQHRRAFAQFALAGRGVSLGPPGHRSRDGAPYGHSSGQWTPRDRVEPRAGLPHQPGRGPGPRHIRIRPAASRSRRAAGVLLAAQCRSATTRAGSARTAGKAGPVLFRRARIKPATTAMQT